MKSSEFAILRGVFIVCNFILFIIASILWWEDPISMLAPLDIISYCIVGIIYLSVWPITRMCQVIEENILIDDS